MNDSCIWLYLTFLDTSKLYFKDRVCYCTSFIYYVPKTCTRVTSIIADVFISGLNTLCHHFRGINSLILQVEVTDGRYSFHFNSTTQQAAVTGFSFATSSQRSYEFLYNCLRLTKNYSKKFSILKHHFMLITKSSITTLNLLILINSSCQLRTMA